MRMGNRLLVFVVTLVALLLTSVMLLGCAISGSGNPSISTNDSPQCKHEERSHPSDNSGQPRDKKAGKRVFGIRLPNWLGKQMASKRE